MTSQGQAALAQLAQARRRNRLASVDWFDAFYQAYLTALGVAVTVVVASTFVPDQRVNATTAARVADEAPALLGAGFAVLIALGIRSGGRGGPLALEAPMIQHVLLAPIERGAALRGPATKQLRFAAYTGAVAGGVAGLLAARRLPVHPAVSVLCGAVAGALVAVAAIGAAMITSGLRASPTVATLGAAVVVAAAGADVAAGTAWSPPALLGRVALWGLSFEPISLVGAAAPVVVATAGLLAVGGTSLEAARRRAGLVSELRFAVTLQDVRTVVLLRRRLSEERPRNRPWSRLGDRGRRRGTVWHRDWQGILRFPAVRILRMAVLGGIAGAALCGAWTGTSSLVIAAGLALYVAALDAVEPLAQEVDHPDRWASFPTAPGSLMLRHLPAPAVVMGAVGVVAVSTATALSRSSVVLPVAGVVLLPVVAATVVGAAATTAQGPHQSGLATTVLPEAAGTALVVRAAWPPLLIVISLLPVLAARAAEAEGLPAAGGAAEVVLGPVLLTAVALAWLWRRSPARR